MISRIFFLENMWESTLKCLLHLLVFLLEQRLKCKTSIEHINNTVTRSWSHRNQRKNEASNLFSKCNKLLLMFNIWHQHQCKHQQTSEEVTVKHIKVIIIFYIRLDCFWWCHSKSLPSKKQSATLHFFYSFLFLLNCSLFDHIIVCLFCTCSRF